MNDLVGEGKYSGVVSFRHSMKLPKATKAHDVNDRAESLMLRFDLLAIILYSTAEL